MFFEPGGVWKKPASRPFFDNFHNKKAKYQGFREVLFGWKIRLKDVHFL
jgi:hypothetical protein